MCDCDHARDTRKFADWQDFHGFQSWLNTNADFAEVPVKKPLSNVGFTENWYMCRKCSAVWRLVEPDPPFEGLWEKIS
jgi:hypothetical protein